MPFIGLIFLALAGAVPHTPILINWTETPELIQVFIQFIFTSLFAVSMMLTGWRFYESV